MSLLTVYQALEQSEWIDIPEGWLQGRTIYGGVVAGLMMQKALLSIADPTKRLLSTSVTFVGPVQQGAARITAEILRQGKSVTTVEVRLWQDDAVQSILIASFGTARSSEIHVRQERAAPNYLPPSIYRACKSMQISRNVISSLMCVGQKARCLVLPVRRVTLAAGVALNLKSIRIELLEWPI